MNFGGADDAALEIRVPFKLRKEIRHGLSVLISRAFRILRSFLGVPSSRLPLVVCLAKGSLAVACGDSIALIKLAQ